MHLLKRIRYEVVIHIKLVLARNYNGSTQVIIFYVPDFQNIVKDICPSFIFCNEFQTKMDDEYPHIMFQRKTCTFLLDYIISNINNDKRKSSFKWLMFCLIGGALDIALTGDSELPESNQMQLQILGFFLMYKIQQNTIPIPNQTRLFTPAVMREYLNLFIAIFREYSDDSCEQALIEKMGSMHLEHFYALVRRYCYYDNHLVSVAHSIERIVALRIIQESDEMKWFNDVNRIQLKKPICKQNFKWDWTIASKMFILADDIFEAAMKIDTKNYCLSLVMLNDISIVIKGHPINEENMVIDQEKNETSLKIFSISDKSFQNKGSNAKSRLLIGKNGMFSGSKNKKDNLIKKEYNNLGLKRSSENNYYGPAFEMETGSNLCFFNQALQTLFHCKSIFNWYKEANPSKLKSLILLDFYFVAFDYYSEEKNILIKTSPYASLVKRYFEQRNKEFGEMGDMADVIEFIMKEMQINMPIFSQFEIVYNRTEYFEETENSAQFRAFIINLSKKCSFINFEDDETEIKVPLINEKEKNNNRRNWINLNLTQINKTELVPNEQRTIKSLNEAFKAFLFPLSSQIEIIYQQKEENCINIDQIQFCIQSIIKFPQYLFIQINHDSYPDDEKNMIIEEKLIFIKNDIDLIEYELISITFFSSNHFYSLHRCWNNHNGLIWIHYNDPEEPISFQGFLDDALLNFNLDLSNAVFSVYLKS